MKHKRHSAFAVLALAAVLVVLGGAPAEVFYLYPARVHRGSGTAVEVTIPAGVGRGRLAEILQRAGVVDGGWRFELWLRASGKLAAVKTGRFHLRDNLTPAEVLDALAARPLPESIRVTIPEGLTLGRIAKTLESKGLVTVDVFLAAATDPVVLEKLGIDGQSAEGFLFPDTYQFPLRTTAVELIGLMYRNFQKRTAALGLGSIQELLPLVTLASIVQAEAKANDEMPTIAGVYRNRLESLNFPSRLLQADPTVAYGCEPYIAPRAPSCATFDGTLSRAQIEDSANPYNTYQQAGLPPGPISAPGLAALVAAQKPAAVPYLYFVANGIDGRHRFSTTLEEHNAAVELYRAATAQ